MLTLHLFVRQSTIRIVKAEETVTFRIPLRLKEEVMQIGVDNGLTMSKAFVQLLLKAVALYRDDGILIDARNREVMQSLEQPKITAQQPKVTAQKRRAG